MKKETNPHYSPVIILVIDKPSKITSEYVKFNINTHKYRYALKLSSRICYVAKSLKYNSIPVNFDVLHLHKANSMNNTD